MLSSATADCPPHGGLHSSSIDPHSPLTDDEQHNGHTHNGPCLAVVRRGWARHVHRPGRPCWRRCPWVACRCAANGPWGIPHGVALHWDALGGLVGVWLGRVGTGSWRVGAGGGWVAARGRRVGIGWWRVGITGPCCCLLALELFWVDLNHALLRRREHGGRHAAHALRSADSMRGQVLGFRA
jgi:hypothetical protein